MPPNLIFSLLLIWQMHFSVSQFTKTATTGVLLPLMADATSGVVGILQLSSLKSNKETSATSYTADLLLCSESREQCELDTKALLTVLAENGHKCSKSKLQLIQPKVKYLGHVLTSEG